MERMDLGSPALKAASRAGLESIRDRADAPSFKFTLKIRMGAGNMSRKQSRAREDFKRPLEMSSVHANFLNLLPDLQNVILNPCLKRRRTLTWLEV